MQNEIDDVESLNQAIINEEEDKISQTINEISLEINDLKMLLETSDACLIIAFEFKQFRLPAPLHVTLYTFTPQKLNRELIYQQIGYLSERSYSKEEDIFFQKIPEALSYHTRLIDEPRFLASINTNINSLSCLYYLRKDKFWTCNGGNEIYLYSFLNGLHKSVKTVSGNIPRDIAVTLCGDLIYTDYNDKSVNLVKTSNVKTLIKLQCWKPYAVCSSASGDLLITMNNDDFKQAKVVRYSDSTEIQSIQWDNHGQPLFSSGPIKHICENRNLDICIADNENNELVVVNLDGRLNFRYKGAPKAKLLDQVGIITDSQSRILTADFSNNCIHIVDQDGHLLRYIDNCDLRCPWGLCVDLRENLFVAEYKTGKVKKIQYCVGPRDVLISHT